METRRVSKQSGGEVNFKKNFCLRYFDPDTWSLDVLNQVDVLLQDKKGNYLLYIESKLVVENRAEHRKAIAQVILTNKKQQAILSRVALIYQDGKGNDVMELIDCSDDSVMYNNDINWKAEKPSNPSKDAIDRINDRVEGRVTVYRNEEIKAVYASLKKRDVAISITAKNVNVVYNHWKNEVVFHEYIPNEQDLINLFLVDLLNGTVYKQSVKKDVEEWTLFGKRKIGEREEETEDDLINEGTKLSNYRIMFVGEVVDGIRYQGYPSSFYYTIERVEQYNAFWRRYKRPPERKEFLKILEHSSMLYSEKYRRDTGGEYTPSCFVEKQNEILARHYNMDDFIVCDPCAGVGNLENQFGKDYKPYCYLSTLEHMDVDTCKIKGFDNAIQFDYFATTEQPQWKYRGQDCDIREIARREGRKLMVVMNPPYQQRKGFANDLAIEFFNKVLELRPDVIVYYCKTEFFLRADTMQHFVRSGYKTVAHIFSNAKTTFQLSEWSVSLVVFDREHGEEITGNYVTADRHELNRSTKQLDFVRTYRYDNVRPNLIKEIEAQIKRHATGMRLGQWTNDHYCLVVSNRQTHHQDITTDNLADALLLKGINFNTHGKYFETSNLTYKGRDEDISQDLRTNAIVFSLFYKGCNFSNKEGNRNFIMPFTAQELGCSANDLNVLFSDALPQEQGKLAFDAHPDEVTSFDFREFLHRFDFSPEAHELYDAALAVFRFYHHSRNYADTDYNDSFYDITNAIMGKDTSSFKTVDATDDRRITRVKTTKGTKGFSRRTIAEVVTKDDLPIFYRFFDARDALAKRINRQLVEQGLLLWERENIY